MRHKLFISYSNCDSEKVELINTILTHNKIFTPLIIAKNREPLMPLSEKVTNGITSAEVVIPILTKKSIKTQWINQEIGYAKAKDKEIIPIVESGLIDKLKGFIHKQIDLPYSFIPNINKFQEHKDFSNMFKILLIDLEAKYSDIVVSASKDDVKKYLEKGRLIKYEEGSRHFLVGNTVHPFSDADTPAYVQKLLKRKHDDALKIEKSQYDNYEKGRRVLFKKV
ncbi:toll/interleukin-1 receptor domain-containing protein [Cryomorpha ignava]|uniref:Toll/interleukin-1 receptor domain-containing protein n=1 Tax=Cryomorpha ignava TaxID=101383 RepID=A0A7K3WMS5_9FLAO|nr:toll/interleukin-1 receptor domain-containing protein [Cryomorpha ignava]NEN22301.1 toll/interleukin-1 receptor domain-containing protein [Cryomorpha ignava]